VNPIWIGPSQAALLSLCCRDAASQGLMGHLTPWTQASLSGRRRRLAGRFSPSQAFKPRPHACLFRCLGYQRRTAFVDRRAVGTPSNLQLLAPAPASTLVCHAHGDGESRARRVPLLCHIYIYIYIYRLRLRHVRAYRCPTAPRA
jgi:hypothetical protein